MPQSDLHNSAVGGWDVGAIRSNFPILSRKVHGKPLVYLDTAASAQRPSVVIDAVTNFYTGHNANVHRGVHTLSQEATELWENARESMREFIGAASCREIIFTRGMTEGVNLVAQSFVRPRVGQGDKIMITAMEHHSNIVPWQLVCEQTGAELVIIPVNNRGEVELEAFAEMLDEQVKMLAVMHVSNALGSINPVAKMCRMAKEYNIPVLIDGAQATPHLQVDVQAIDCDFYCVSGHKMYGPTGSGVLYGRENLLEAMPPYHGGGEMIRTVTFEKSTWNDLPSKFEAGTPNIAGGIGLGAAAQFIQGIGRENIRTYEADLLNYGTRRLEEIDGLRIIGTAAEKASVMSFIIEGTHPHDIGTIIDHAGVAIRTGHHCAMPILKQFGVVGTARASLGMYNTREEIDVLVAAVEKACVMLR
ncbi:MAG: SufS family cysteine desulfurase [Xanthomonadales bacterium]|nr:SufS family cysteine desulfurase [Xanthomonadales bacterium]